MLGNQVELWETILAAMKLGAMLIPATTLLAAADLADRIDRGEVAHVIADVDHTPVRRGARRLHPDRRRRRGGRLADVRRRRRAAASFPAATAPPGPTTRCCCTSPPARPRQPKLVEHTYRPTRSATCRRCTGSACGRGTCTSTSPRPAGPSTPGATCSRPWNAEATALVHNTRGSPPPALLEVLRPVRGHQLLRAADGVADAHPGGPRAPRTPALRGRRARASRSTRR